jgi:hypothetical protein
MKNLILKRLQGLYFYYSTGATADVPYLKTMSVFLMLIFLHYLEFAFLLVRFADIGFDLFPFREGVSRGTKSIIILLCIIPVYLLLTRLFPEKVISTSLLSDVQLLRYRNQFFIYAGLLLIAIIITLWPSIKFL